PPGPGANPRQAGRGLLSALPGGVELPGGRGAARGLGRCRRRPAAPGAQAAPGSAGGRPKRPARAGARTGRPPTGTPLSATPPPLPPEDPLDGAEAALRRAPVPDGPSEETRARTLAALRAADRLPVLPVRRRKTMHLILKVVASLLVAAGGLVYFIGLY